VHSAPAYGVEDFESCRRYGMKDDEILTPVMGDGRFAASLPLFGGQSIWSANAAIVKTLAERGVLFANETYTHSYMHCWRHKTPVILRATTQWFAALDDSPGLSRQEAGRAARARALRGIEATQFFPAWGQARLHGMIANRPDWTLSRQRQWGVPMPFFLHKETGEPHPRTLELIEQVAQRVAKGRRRGVAGHHRRGVARRGCRELRQEPRHARRVVRLGIDAPHGAARIESRARLSGRSLPGRIGSASRVVPQLASDCLHDRWCAALQSRC
jgi:isoleucyl-tRNA synthetase